MEKEKNVEELKRIAKYVRSTALDTIVEAKNGHIGGNMSSVELLTALYFGGIFHFDPEDSKNENRDRVIIRGHEGPLRYTIFSLLGYIDKEELHTYRKFGSRLHGHEDRKETPGVDITPTGSLGMVLSYGVGSAIANKDKGLDAKTIVFLGDGEEQEGNVSEAARHASTLDLDNLICILDQNKKQLSRPTEESDGHDIRKIWEGYGWDVLEIKDGHDIEEILDVYKKLEHIKKPTLVIASTVKGYGVKGAEDHYSGYHTLSAVEDKNDLKTSVEKLHQGLEEDSITAENATKLALKNVKVPSKKILIPDYDPSIFDIRTTDSKVSPQVAHEDYFRKLRERVEKDNRVKIYYITPDLYRKPEVAELGYEKFMHFIDTGIREQHSIAMSHGISVENPDARICLCFGDPFVYRALDQINAAVMGESNMTIIGVWPGIQGAQNGKTHQTVSQPSALIGIPELNFYEPADAIDLYNVFSHAFTENKGVNYVRLSKENIELERNKEDERNIDSYFVHVESTHPDVQIISSGFTVKNCVEAAKKLKAEFNINANVINVVNPKTFSKTASKLLTNDAPILTVYNGDPEILEKMVAQAILRDSNIPRPKKLETHGFLTGTTGTMSDLVKHYGFDEDSIKQKVLKLVR